jgi:hypothetical protein
VEKEVRAKGKGPFNQAVRNVRDTGSGGVGSFSKNGRKFRKREREKRTGRKGRRIRWKGSPAKRTTRRKESLSKEDSMILW